MGRENQSKKTCTACGDELPVTLFPRIKKEKLCFRCHKPWPRYRLSHYDIADMLTKQKYKCAICEKPINGKTLNIDHCHKSKKVRGLLCMRCNIGIGHFEDSKQSLTNAIKYLKKHGQKEKQ